MAAEAALRPLGWMGKGVGAVVGDAHTLCSRYPRRGGDVESIVLSRPRISGPQHVDLSA